MYCMAESPTTPFHTDSNSPIGATESNGLCVESTVERASRAHAVVLTALHGISRESEDGFPSKSGWSAIRDPERSFDEFFSPLLRY